MAVDSSAGAIGASSDTGGTERIVSSRETLARDGDGGRRADHGTDGQRRDHLDRDDRPPLRGSESHASREQLSQLARAAARVDDRQLDRDDDHAAEHTEGAQQAQ